MRKFYLTSTLVLSLCFAGRIVSAQDFSNKGKDFWLGYGYHQLMSGNSQNMVLYFATDTFSSTTVTVEIPGIGFSQTYPNIGPNAVFQTPPLPKNAPQDSRLTTEGLHDKGIHITSTRPIVAYSHVYTLNVSGASILFPTPTLGKEYYSINFTNISNSANSNCWFYVLATDTGTTTVEITPTGNTIGGWSAGNTYTVSLTQGQIYNVMGTYSGSSGVDLTGSHIKSVATSSGACKRIAVFSGSGRISITCNGSPASSDYYMTQAFPKTAWGKRYLTVPTGGAMLNNFFRICVTDPTTNVTLNGFPIPYPLQGGFYYEIPATQTPYYIESDQPVCVAQYITSQGNCGNGTPGDPEVIYLSSVEQNINKVTFNSTPNTVGNISQHYFHAIVPNDPAGTGVSSFRLDGAAPAPGSWIPHPANPSYSYIRQAVSAGPHIIQSDSGFNAVAYGYGNAESYGYNAGTNIKDIFQFITLQNQYATVNFPATCTGAPFYFAMTFPYQPVEIRWIFGPALNAMGIADVTLLNPVYDSTYVVGGKQLYRYKLPTPYTITAPGTYPINVIAFNPTPDGCGGVQEIPFDVQVFDPPTAEFNFTTTGCLSDPVNFFDMPQNTGGRAIIQWMWDFDDGNTATTANTVHTYAASGVYNVAHRIVTDIGCISQPLVHPVTINDPPVAGFTASTPRCIGTPITFTNSSTAPPGNTISTWEWDFGDGSPIVIATTGANQVHTYSGTGPYMVKLKVTTTAGCQSTDFILPVSINVNPVAGFTFPGICLPAGNAQFTNTTSISDGTLPTVTYFWDFGDGNTSTATNPMHIYSGTGPFNVTLTATSQNGCVDDTIRLLNTISPEPQAAFLWPANVCLGSNAQFTDQSVAPGSSVTQWAWDFGDGNTSTIQNPGHIYAAPGTYTVTLNVTSAAGCATVTQFAQHQVNVIDLPNATIAGNASTLCQNAASPVVTFTGTGGTAPYLFTYNINGGPPLTVSSGPSSTATINVPTGTPGTFTYTLVSVQEGSSAGCTRGSLNGTATFTISPLPTATITGNATVCLNAPQPTITFTGANGIAPYTFIFRIGTGPNQTIITSAGNSVSLSVPTNVAGTITYTLIRVSESGPNSCAQDQSGTVTITVNPLPTASVTGTNEVCLNSASPTITFTGANGQAPFIFTYNINGGAPQTATSTGNSASVTVPTGTAGVFNYNLVSVQENSGCMQAQTGTVVVTVNDLPIADFNQLAPFCENQTVNFSDASIPNSASVTNWQWNFDDPSSGANNTSTLQNPSHSFATARTYNVTLIVTNDKGCVSIVRQKPVTINPKPLAAFTPPIACENDVNAQFTDNSTPTGTIATWNWIFNDPNANAGNPNTSTIQNPTHHYTVGNDYTARLIISDNNGCIDSVDQTFRINGSVTVADFQLQNTGPLCSEDMISINDNSTVSFGTMDRLEIYWNWPNATDVTIDDDPQPGEVYTHSYPKFTTPATQNFNVRYIASTGASCATILDRTVTMLAMPELSFGPVTGICEDVPAFQITQATLMNGLPGTGTFSGRGVSPTGLFTPSAAGAGTHVITYTFNATNGCSEDTSQTIDVYPKPAVNAGPDKAVLEGGSVTLTPSLNVGVPVTYLWTPPTFLSNPNISNAIVIAPDRDIWYELTVTSEFGCVDSDSVFVKLLKDPVIPNIFSPNGDGIHDRWVIEFLETYPGCVVQIYNRYGQMVYRIVNYTTPWDGKINGKDAPVGTYYYIIDPKNGRKPMTGFVDIIR
jgi:gliding motility-associated-like protein